MLSAPSIRVAPTRRENGLQWSLRTYDAIYDPIDFWVYIGTWCDAGSPIPLRSSPHLPIPSIAESILTSGVSTSSAINLAAAPMGRWGLEALDISANDLDHLSGRFLPGFLHTPLASDRDTQGELAIGGHTVDWKSSPYNIMLISIQDLRTSLGPVIPARRVGVEICSSWVPRVSGV